MTTDIAPENVAIRQAATVVLRRPGAAGPEVLMLRRSPNLIFVGGHYVFPGGAVDSGDAELATDAERVTWNDVQSKPSSSWRSGDDATNHHLETVTHIVCAVREAFEEAGVLLARRRDQSTVDFGDTRTSGLFSAYRTTLNAGEIDFSHMLESEDLHINASDLTYWSRWITPLGSPRRFDARFFLADLPVGHIASPDHGELVASEWVRPKDALLRHQAGEFPIILPTIKTLQSLT